jgi:hypothetical protein
MGWQWIEDLFAPDHKEKLFWPARCPYHLCPSNQPFRGAYPARLKFIQTVGIMVRQFKCRDCGNLCNISMEMPKDRNDNEIMRRNPALWGGKPSYKFKW